MVYFRRRYTRRKGRAFGTRYRRRRLATFTRAIVNRVAELKVFTRSISVTPLPGLATWQFGSFLAGIKQGTSAEERIGSQIYVKKIVVMIKLSPLADTFEADQALAMFCRIMLYRNRQANGALPPWDSVWYSNTYSALRNVPNIRRISVLRDYMHSMQRLSLEDTVPTVSGTSVFQWTIYPRKNIQFSSNNGTVADILTNDYGIGWCASMANCCLVDAQWQVWFNDV